MRITQAGLRSGYPITRFAAPPTHRREPHLGLHRRLAPQITSHAASSARVPLLKALRSAARSVSSSASVRPEENEPLLHRAVVLRRNDAITWSRTGDGQAHRPRSRSAAPWRG